MTQQTIDFQPAERLSLCDKLEAYFRARPHQEIDGVTLEQIAGRYGWRTRVSNLRRQRGMDIKNRQERYLGFDGQKRTRSLYRYVPEGQ